MCVCLAILIKSSVTHFGKEYNLGFNFLCTYLHVYPKNLRVIWKFFSIPCFDHNWGEKIFFSISTFLVDKWKMSLGRESLNILLSRKFFNKLLLKSYRKGSTCLPERCSRRREQHDSARCLLENFWMSVCSTMTCMWKGPPWEEGRGWLKMFYYLFLQWRREMFSEFCFLGARKIIFIKLLLFP